MWFLLSKVFIPELIREMFRIHFSLKPEKNTKMLSQDHLAICIQSDQDEKKYRKRE